VVLLFNFIGLAFDDDDDDDDGVDKVVEVEVVADDADVTKGCARATEAEALILLLGCDKLVGVSEEAVTEEDEEEEEEVDDGCNEAIIWLLILEERLICGVEGGFEDGEV
jgi:hypothetical protein